MRSQYVDIDGDSALHVVLHYPYDIDALMHEPPYTAHYNDICHMIMGLVQPTMSQCQA